MVNISEIILFYSQFSPKCKNILSLVDYYNFPVTRISVDSKDVRSKIQTGTNFKIKGVPTIIVTYTDDNAELYEGEKVMSWLSQLAAPSKQNRPTSQESEDYDDEYEILDESPVPRKTGKNVKDQKMADIKDLAKQMEAERKRTLGYDENNLPY